MNRLRELRKKRRLTLDELSKQIGVNLSTLARYERGDIEITGGMLIKLSSFFNVSIDYLLCRTNDRKGSSFVEKTEDESKFFPSTTSERLKALRKEKGMTESDVASVISINDKTLCDYERNKTEPSIDTIKGLAKLYNVSIDYLLGASDERRAKTLDPFVAAIEELFKDLTEEQKKDLLQIILIFKKNLSRED